MLHSSSEDESSSLSSTITSSAFLLLSTTIDWVNYHLEVKHTNKNVKQTRLQQIPSFFYSLQRYQSCKHIRASTVFGLSEFRFGVITFLLKLKADSEATLDTGTARISCAILASCGYLAADLLQKSKILTFTFNLFAGSAK